MLPNYLHCINSEWMFKTFYAQPLKCTGFLLWLLVDVEWIISCFIKWRTYSFHPLFIFKTVVTLSISLPHHTTLFYKHWYMLSLPWTPVSLYCSITTFCCPIVETCTSPGTWRSLISQGTRSHMSWAGPASQRLLWCCAGAEEAVCPTSSRFPAFNSTVSGE